MFHGLDNRLLYVAYQPSCTFTSGVGDPVTCTGTGFWVRTADSILALVTNRNVLDIEFADSKYAAVVGFADCVYAPGEDRVGRHVVGNCQPEPALLHRLDVGSFQRQVC